MRHQERIPTMKLYRIISAVAQVGQGDVITIDDKQLRRRAPFVDIVRRANKDNARHTVRARKALEFKVGEVVGLDRPPKSPLFEEMMTAAPASKAA